MASPSRLKKLGLQDGLHPTKNTQDSYLQTFEFPVVAVATAAEQDSGVVAPTKSVQVVSAYLYVNTAEATAAVKTLTIGTTSGSGADALGATSVAATGPVGTPVAAAFVGGGNWSYTLVDTDFIELDAVCVVTVLATDS
jgi:hypothetical protein